jgi:hypothetical protein
MSDSDDEVIIASSSKANNDPSTTLGTHLLGACTAFQESSAWNSDTVQSGLAKNTFKQVNPARHFVFKGQLSAQQAILSVTSAPKLSRPFKFALRCAKA